MKKRLKAFTLAEVLITLMIIGVVAALTISTVVANYQKNVVEAQLLKAYNNIFNAIKMSEVYNGLAATWEYASYSGINSYGFVEQYIAPYIKGQVIKNVTMRDLGYLDTAKYLVDNSDWLGLDDTIPCAIKFNDGSLVIDIEPGELSRTRGSGSYIYLYITVDINGSKKPNIVGKDIFDLELMAIKGQSRYSFGMYGLYNVKNYTSSTGDLEIINNTEKFISDRCKESSKYSENVFNAEYCGAWIQLNGWKIPEGYPYL